MSQAYLYAHTLSVLKKMPKMVLYPKNEWSNRPKTLACRHSLTLSNNMGLVPSGSAGEHYKFIYIDTPLSVLKIKAEKDAFSSKKK